MRIHVALLLLVLAPFASAADLSPWQGGATPPLALQDLDGKTHRLEDYRGKVVLINFWATWCEPCREEMPSLGRLRASFAGKPFAVLAVNLSESEPRIRRFLEQLPTDFVVLRDGDGAAARAWKTRILPATFIVAPDGRIRYHQVGDFDWSQEKVKQAVSALLPR
jgi:thiol-disulfide isomerase/thioredoxin